jgi:hypothetical protein
MDTRYADRGGGTTAHSVAIMITGVERGWLSNVPCYPSKLRFLFSLCFLTLTLLFWWGQIDYSDSNT